jgi:ubiquinone/menaquinone biosynthesis C-methylase UbiE
LKKRYVDCANYLKGSKPTHAEAMQEGVGGAFDQVGKIEVALLQHAGLKPGGYLIDVGCGSGRLAIPLSRTHTGPYLGTDLVPDFLQYARENTNERRPDWRFEEVHGLTIPEQDGVADITCFFSVFTHLLHEQSYLYLEEAKRVLKPGGRVVFSFLELPLHATIFQDTVRREKLALGKGAVLNVFMDRISIRYWADSLGFMVVLIESGDASFIPIPEPIALDGRILSGTAHFFQSVCVLQS